MREDRIIKKLEEMDVRFDKIDGRLEKMDGRFDKMDGRLNSLESGQEKLVVEVVNIKDYMFTHMATKAELHATENRLLDHIDGLHRKTEVHDHEITANRSRSERLEGRVSTIENRLGTA